MSNVSVAIEKIGGVSALRYSYRVNRDVAFRFYLSREVGEPWRLQAERKASALAARHGKAIKQVELDVKPWFVDALVNKE